jgi:hypothetical protein
MLMKEKLSSERRDVSTLSMLRLLLLKMHVVKLQMNKEGLDGLLHRIDMIILNVMLILLHQKSDGLLHRVEMTRLNKILTLLDKDWFGRMQIVER